MKVPLSAIHIKTKNPTKTRFGRACGKGFSRFPVKDKSKSLSTPSKTYCTNLRINISYLQIYFYICDHIKTLNHVSISKTTFSIYKCS